MRKTPSYLKGLAETRARAAGDIQRLKKIQEEVAQKLAQAQDELEACDRLIRKYDARLNPELIQPIRAWQGRYGKRGALQATIKRLLQEAFPEAIDTTELLWALQIEFQLDFPTWQEKHRWRRNSLTPALKDLVAAGLANRLGLHPTVDLLQSEERIPPFVFAD
jgi:hypothetical protein